MSRSANLSGGVGNEFRLRMFNKTFQRGRSEKGGEAYSVRYVEPPCDMRTMLEGLLCILLVGLQHVSTPTNGMDEFFAAASVNLVAQIIHVDIDDVRKRVEVLVPHMFGDHGSCEHAAGVAHQVFEQGIFLEGQLDPLPSSGHIAGRRIEDKIIDLEYARALGGATSKKGPNPRKQFIDGERFGQVVIRSRIEPLDPLVDLRLGGQNKNGGLDAGPANPFQHLQARQRGQHEINDDQVVARGERHLKAFSPVFTQIDGVALLFKCALDEAADFRFVFDHEDTHSDNQGL
jgi:hypothetical protein